MNKNTKHNIKLVLVLPVVMLIAIALAPFVALHDALMALTSWFFKGYVEKDYRALRLWPWFDL